MPLGKTMKDEYASAQCSRTAASFAKLASYAGVAAVIRWDGSQYIANGTPCGPSVHGLYDWLNKQSGAK